MKREPAGPRLEGTVYRGNSGNYSIRVPGDDREYIARLRGNLKKEFVYSTSGSGPNVSLRRRSAGRPTPSPSVITFVSTPMSSRSSKSSRAGANWPAPRRPLTSSTSWSPIWT